MQAFKYDVAFSLVSGDEPLAQQIADLLSDRYKMFLYTERQRELAGTDGEVTFKSIFARESRFVVVLHRARWGQTPWTRMEEEAIRGRAYEEGYDFVKFIPLDEKPSLPQYLPKTQLWINALRLGAKGAASVIEARLEELGAISRREDAVDRAARLERAINYEKRREMFASSPAGVSASDASFEAIALAVESKIAEIKARGVSVSFSTKRERNAVVVLGLSRGMRIHWVRQYANTLSGAYLDLEIWDGHPPMTGFDSWERPTCLKTKKYKFEMQVDGTGKWVRDRKPSTAVDPDAFADNALKFYMDQSA
jgi:hypothetical protein